MAAYGRELLLASVPEEDVRRKAIVRGSDGPAWRWFPDTDRALEWCEIRVLADQTLDTTYVKELPFERLDLCVGLNSGDIAALKEKALRQTLPAGTKLFQQGGAGDAIFLLAHGRVSMMLVRRDDLPEKRIATFAPGVTFGEMAYLQDGTRSATARCDTDVVLWVISADTLDLMNHEAPALAATLYRALARHLANRLREQTLELHDMSGP